MPNTVLVIHLRLLILEELGESSQLIVADIGAETGISSRLLANRGIKVIARLLLSFWNIESDRDRSFKSSIGKNVDGERYFSELFLADITRCLLLSWNKR